MHLSLPTLNQVRITNPCPAQWQGMTGDARNRYCETCRKHVHDLSARTIQETAALFASEPRPCVRVVRDWCGRVVTADRPLLRVWPARFWWMYPVWAALAFVFMGCKQATMGMVPEHYRD